MSSEAYHLIKQFHTAFGAAINAPDTLALRKLRADLITEEAEEARDALMDAHWDGNDAVAPMYGLEDIAKELADIIYVAYGTAISLGIDLDEAVRRVHASNMSKIGSDGEIRYRPDGKVLKPDTYLPPDMTGVARA